MTPLAKNKQRIVLITSQLNLSFYFIGAFSVYLIFTFYNLKMPFDELITYLILYYLLSLIMICPNTGFVYISKKQLVVRRLFKRKKIFDLSGLSGISVDYGLYSLHRNSHRFPNVISDQVTLIYENRRESFDINLNFWATKILLRDLGYHI